MVPPVSDIFGNDRNHVAGVDATQGHRLSSAWGERANLKYNLVSMGGGKVKYEDVFFEHGSRREEGLKQREAKI